MKIIFYLRKQSATQYKAIELARNKNDSLYNNEPASFIQKKQEKIKGIIDYFRKKILLF